MPRVSTSLSFTKNSSVLRRALSLIDSVHGDGVLPKIRVFEASAGSYFDGRYQYSLTNAYVPTILMAPPCGSHEFALVHEIGHFLDHKALDPSRAGFASENTQQNDLTKWMAAIDASAEIVQLRDAHRRCVDVGSTAYLLDSTELWARSYTQWVVREANDASMLHDLDVARRSADPLEALSQWSDANFVSIAQEISALFSKRGWI